MATGSSQSLNSFVRAHSTQLKALPVGLWKILHHKLQQQLLGVSSNFSIQQGDIGRGIIIYTPTNETEKILRKDSDLWIIPHQFTYESDNLRKQITVDRDLRNLVLKISSLKTGEKCQVHSVEDEIENAIKSIWSLVETYTITVMNDQNQPEQKYLWCKSNY
ncbi:hypothetical protein BKA69DRAFT_1054027 [Paraphysoderma sedebokerense]|nr:hypothetical protein BKA69DRAFT_1054027 [Paraphysoderma sedebokerense]